MKRRILAALMALALPLSGMLAALAEVAAQPAFSWRMDSAAEGAVLEWMMGWQLGISAGEDAGYQHFILRPTAGGDFTFARGGCASAYGVIESGWTAEDGVMTSYDCTVPANTTATLYLPAPGSAGVPEGAAVVGETTYNGVEVIEIELTSGTYHFDVTIQSTPE